MLHNLKKLIGYGIIAIDGEIGKVEEFYFDDQNWAIRYLIVKAANWLNGRKVLIAPVALINKPSKLKYFQINLNKDQIRNSPDIDTEKPVSRQQEIELYGHYAWQGYWQSGFYEGGLEEVVDTSKGTGEKIANAATHEKKAHFDIHLRSSGQVTGYNLLGHDGKIGIVEDLIMEDSTWHLTYLSVCKSEQPGAGIFSIPIELIKHMEWRDSEFYYMGKPDSNE